MSTKKVILGSGDSDETRLALEKIAKELKKEAAPERVDPFRTPSYVTDRDLIRCGCSDCKRELARRRDE